MTCLPSRSRPARKPSSKRPTSSSATTPSSSSPQSTSVPTTPTPPPSGPSPAPESPSTAPTPPSTTPRRHQRLPRHRLGLVDLEPLRPARPAPLFKIAVFCPRSDRETVLSAAFSAGAGQIGAYGECSFSTAGFGTFRGDETTHPTIGQPGRRETVREWRVEVICPASRLAPSSPPSALPTPTRNPPSTFTPSRPPPRPRRRPRRPVPHLTSL